jgi:hypothetical protein
MPPIYLWFLLMGSFGWMPDEMPTKIDLGGPRRVMATVREKQGNYEIEVELIPVRCFSDSMNRRLTRDKARASGIEALIRHLDQDDSRKHTVDLRHVQITGAEESEKRFRVNLMVPIKAIRLGGSGDAQRSNDTSRTAAIRPAFKAKEDYQETLDFLVRMLEEDLPLNQGDPTVFYAAISDAEERCVADLKSLRNEVSKDRWLLSDDRNDLIKRLQMAEEQYLHRLKRLIEEADHAPESN